MSTIHSDNKKPKLFILKFDDILKNVGFGRYQIQNLILLNVLLWSGKIFDNGYMFYSAVQKYRCRIPGCDDERATYREDWIGLAIPFTDIDEPANCVRFQNHVLNDTTWNLDGNCTTLSFDRNSYQTCMDGYVFESNSLGITEEFQIHCDENMWQLTLPGSIFNFGCTVAGLYTGYLSDRFGRRKVLIYSIFLAAFASECKAFFGTTYELLLLFEFLHAMASTGTFQPVYTLTMELLKPSQRLFGATITQIVSAFASICLGIIALHTTKWRLLVQIASVPGLLVIFYGWLCPESIRWLLSKQKYDEANRSIKKMANKNKVILSEENYVGCSKINLSMNDVDGEFLKSKVDSFRNIFKSTKLCIRVCVMSLCYLTCTFVTCAINLGSTTVFGYSKMNYIYTISVDIFGTLITFLLADRIGRKTTSCTAFIISGICCIAFAFLEEKSNLRVFCYFLGKCMIITAYTTDYILITELFPTRYRQRLIAICTTFGRIGSILAPQVPYLTFAWKPLPFTIFGILSLLAGFASLLFPETLGSCLPTTIEDAENIGQTQWKTKKSKKCDINRI